MRLIKGNKYRFKDQPDTPDLTYIGRQNGRSRFAKYEDGPDGVIWAESLDRDLHMIEPTAAQGEGS